MPIVNIQGTIINFPDSAQSPNWAEPIVQFAVAVAGALQSVAGPFDVPPQIFTMTSNANTNVSLPSLAFPTSNVRGALIEYTVYRTTTTNNGAEFGTLEIVYNVNNSIGNKWEIANEHTGQSEVTFSITDTGQVQFTSTLLPGASHQGFIGYTAKALQQG